MKKSCAILAAMLLAFLPTLALADDGVGMFKNIAGTSWSAFEADLKRTESLKEGKFPTKILSEIGYARACPKAEADCGMTVAGYGTLFRMQNNLDTTIGVAEFRQLAASGNIKLPVLQVSAAPAPVAAVTTAVETSTVDQQTIAGLVSKVAKLQAAVRKPGVSSSQLTANTALVKGLQEQIEALKLGQSRFASNDDFNRVVKDLDGRLDSAFAAMGQEIKTLQGEVGSMGARLQSVEGTVKNFDSRVQALEGQSLTVWNSWTTWVSVSALALAMMALILVWMKKTPTVVEEDDYLSDVKMRDIKEMVAKVSAAEAELPSYIEPTLDPEPGVPPVSEIRPAKAAAPRQAEVEYIPAFLLREPKAA